MDDVRDTLRRLPRLGLPRGVVPVDTLDISGRTVLVHRDDQHPALFGGTKPRKLDLLLAASPFAGAPSWTSMGAIGSGHLVALIAAAQPANTPVDAHVFWERPTPALLANLAWITRARSLTYHRTRVHLARVPSLVGIGPSAAIVVPPGGTHPAGDLGLVEAALEFADRVGSGEIARPDRIYVALGSGGTAVGLAVGFALAGFPVEVVGVAAVERWLVPPGRLRRHADALFGRLGVPTRAIRLRTTFAAVGNGYAEPTRASEAAAAMFAGHGIDLDGVYTAKAAAALLGEWTLEGLPMLWHTAGRTPPAPEGWRDRVPRSLTDDLAAFDRNESQPSLVSRRELVFGALALASLGVLHRMTGYPGGDGHVLNAAELATLAAAAAVILPPAPGPYDAVPAAVDTFVRAMSPPLRRDLHALLALVEHGTPAGAHIDRFTRLDVDARGAVLAGIASAHPLGAVAIRGLRDLVYLGYYQAPDAWGALAYEGPSFPAPNRFYEPLRAPLGATPRSAR